MLIFILGTMVGSFLNVVIHRVPRGESIVRPGSHCPHCGRPVRALENIPILSYIFLWGRCAGCRGRISLRYPVVEALMGLLAVAMLMKFGLTWDALHYTALAALLLALSAIDLDTMRLPNAITLSGALIAAATTLLLRRDAVLMMLLGGLMGLGLMIFMGLLGKVLFRKETLGYGDVKLGGMIGLFVGPWHTLGMFVFGVATGAVIGLGAILIGRREWGSRIPFGPFLALGTLVSLFWGQAALDWYLRLAMRVAS